MRPASLFVLPLVIGSVLLCAVPSSFAATRARHKPAAANSQSRPAPGRATRSSGKRVASRSTHGKAAGHTKASVASHAPMDTARATQIQTALIKSGYLSGEATGQWDATSMAAMQKLQSDNGWQTKNVPDSRALIKLGLGPNAAPTPTPNN